MKTISSIHNPIVQHLVGLAKNSDYRRECKSLLLEGKNAIQDLGRVIKITRLIVTDQTLIPENLPYNEVLIVSDAIMKKISSVKTSEGMIAEFPFPEMVPLTQKKRIIALDRVRDPGNLGTILRSALALGWDGLFLLPGCTDPFGDKALRAAKGATFQLPIQQGSWEELERLIHANQMIPLVADFGGEHNLSHFCPDSLALILGNEGEGIQIPKTLQAAVVSIPTSSSMPSLNVAIAGGILMHLLRAPA